jgi:DNA-binding transcriptional LysR family regulator
VLDISYVVRAKERSLDREDIVEGGSLETIRQMVASGVGVTVLPSTSIGAGGAGDPIRILPFSRPAPTRRVGLAWRRSFRGRRRLRRCARRSPRLQSFAGRKDRMTRVHATPADRAFDGLR